MSGTTDALATLVFLQEQKRWVMERHEEIQVKIESEEDQAKSHRTTCLSTAAFLVPLVISLVPLNIISLNESERAAIAIASVAGFLALAFTILENLARGKSANLKQRFSPLRFAMDVYINSFTSTQAMGGAEEGEDLNATFCQAGMIVFTAIMYQLLGMAEKHLDESVRDLIVRQTDFFVGKKDLACWGYVDSNRVQAVFATNTALRDSVRAFRTHCRC